MHIYAIIYCGDTMRYTAICDFDGTLTGATGRLTDTTAAKIKEFMKENKLCIASYTDLAKLEEIRRKHSLACDLFSFSSAAGILNQSGWYLPMPAGIVRQLLTEFDSFIYTAYAVSLNQVYIIHYQSRLELFYPTGERKIVSSIDAPIPGITIALSKEAFKNLCFFLQETGLSYQLLASDRNRDILFISAKPPKRELVSHLKKLYPGTTTVGIGDSQIDYEFIQYCDIKVAMKNAEEELKKLCDKTTMLENTEDGCMTELIRLYNS